MKLDEEILNRLDLEMLRDLLMNMRHPIDLSWKKSSVPDLYRAVLKFHDCNEKYGYRLMQTLETLNLVKSHKKKNKRTIRYSLTVDGVNLITDLNTLIEHQEQFERKMHEEALRKLPSKN